MIAKNKKKSYNFGLNAETIASWFLRAKGYRILFRRHRNPLGEIDIIATKRKSLVMVEVKGRKSTLPELLSNRQQQRITRAASLFIAKRQEFANLSIRFDIILVRPWRVPKHIYHAWEVTDSH